MERPKYKMNQMILVLITTSKIQALQKTDTGRQQLLPINRLVPLRGDRSLICWPSTGNASQAHTNGLRTEKDSVFLFLFVLVQGIGSSVIHAKHRL